MVTVLGTYSTLNISGPCTIAQQPYNINSSGGVTTFNFKGKFGEVNVAQTFIVGYVSNGNQTKPFTFKNIKSLFYNNSTSCPQIQPKTNPVTAPLCMASNVSISFDPIKWSTYGESSAYCFGFR